MIKILVVDDVPMIREAISVLLEEKGYETRTAKNGREGMKVFSSYQPDLVLTDIVMPDMEGIEFLRTLREKDKKLPIIVMSGNYVGEDFLKPALLLGAAAFLKKPFSNEELLSTVSKCLLFNTGANHDSICPD
ncbi:MAG: response regulator [Spirochaetales bacterium]|nr:response regulator [Spirochaetales bacterium]